MMINELTGYKLNTIYATAKDLFDPNKTHSLESRGVQLKAFTKFLESHGFHRLGSGAFGTIYEKTGYPWVFKIFTKDPAYIEFLQYAIENQSNSNLPKIKGNVIKINQYTYAVRMEKLVDNGILNNWRDVMIPISNYNNYKASIEDEKYLQEYYPGIMKIISHFNKHPKWQFDMHSGNIMARDPDTPVIVDPIYDTHGMDESKLFELYGYKSNKIHKTAKELFDPNTMKSISLGIGYSRNHQMKKFVAFLQKEGFYKIGAPSAFAAVFEKPGYPWVFKIFNNDRAYLTYLKWVLAHQSNPNVPKIRGKIIKINNDTYAVRMEKLQPLTKSSGYNEKLVSLLNQNPRDWSDDQDQYVIDNYPGIFEIIKELLNHNWKIDIHGQNIMLRGNTLVIIDPVADIANLEETNIFELTGFKNDPIYMRAKKVFHPNNLNKLTMMPNDMHIGEIREKFVKYMNSQGFSRLGLGAYADIYEKPGYKWIFKLFIKDNSYLDYVNYCLLHQSNPAVPRFRGNPIRLNEHVYVVRMEKLTPIKNSDPLIAKFFKTVMMINHMNEFNQDNIEFLQNNFPDILQILQDVDKFGYEFDLSRANFMMRGPTMVITDPLYPDSESKSLMELTGYKANPVYQRTRKIFSLPNNAMPKLKDRKDSLLSFTSLMFNNGFEKLGSGLFGATFEKPGYPWVFKVFQHDPAYMEFLKYAIAHQSNPNVPKIKGKMIRISHDTFAVRMEKLKMYHTQTNVNIDELNRALLWKDKLKDLSETTKKWIESTFPGVYKILSDLEHLPYRLDIHPFNFMMRGDTVVITDPLADDNNFKESATMTVNELRGYKGNNVYQAAQKHFSGYTSTITKLERFNNELKLLNYVFDKKGSGSRGAVYKRPGDPYVIKIFHNDADYLKYLTYAKAHQDNPHVPKIRGNLMKIDKNTFAIRLEELSPLQGLFGRERELVNMITKASTWRDLAENQDIEIDLPELHTLFVDLSYIYGWYKMTDLIEANIMLRGRSTIVITDPS